MKYNTNSKHKNSSGFAMVEMLIITGVLLVLGAVGYVIYKKTSQNNQKTASSEAVENVKITSEVKPSGGTSDTSNSTASEVKTYTKEAKTLETPCYTLQIPANSTYRTLAVAPCDTSFQNEVSPFSTFAIISSPDTNADDDIKVPEKTLQELIDQIKENYGSLNKGFKVVAENKTKLGGSDAISLEWSGSATSDRTNIVYVVNVKGKEYPFNTSGGHRFVYNFTVGASPYTKNGQSDAIIQEAIKTFKWK